MNRTRQLVFTLAAMLLTSIAMKAQAVGVLAGQVLDPSGAAIPGATITLSGPANLVKVGISDNTGRYSIPGLPNGQYTIRVAAPGFTLYEKTGADVTAGQTTALNITLTVAVEKQEVTVSDSQQISLDPDKNAGALVLKGEDLDILPDDPDDLQADLLALAGPAAGPNGGQIFIDGFSNGQLPPKDSIREIRINSNPFSSEFDQPGYGRIEIFTKPGTDKLHGMVQMNYGDSIWNARNPYSVEKPYYNTQNLNANLSGALSKKLSFFFDFSRRDIKDSELINAQVVDPTTFAVTTLNQSVIAPNFRTSVSPRFDYQLTKNITLQGRYSWVGSELDNQGVGGFNLLNTAATNHSANQNIQLTETWVASPTTINETRFQYQRQRTNSSGVDPTLNVSVADAFTEGSNFPLTYTNADNYELQNITSVTHGKHFFKYGARFRDNREHSYSTNNYPGQFTFSSINSYVETLSGIAEGLPLSQIVANGGGPYQYTVAAGNPLLGLSQFDAGLFFQDDWRVLPNLTLNLGGRYEAQTNIGDKSDFAPRLGLAWGIGSPRNRSPKTVLRAGYGWFYTRFPLGDVLQSERFNGINQFTYTVSEPQFYPAAGVPIPALSDLTTQAAATYHIDSNLRAPLLMQGAIGVDRQLPKNVTLSVNYILSRGIHQLQAVDINTPLPGTYNPLTQQGVYPLGEPAGVYNLYESSGTFKQDQLVFNSTARINSKLTLQGYYAYGHANSNVNGSPSNPYNFAQDWGRAAYDIRHRINFNGTISAPFGIRLSPNLTFNSAPPFNITQGVDELGDKLLNTRPAFAPGGFTAPACTPALANGGTPCIMTVAQYGTFVINPLPGMKIIPVNYGTAFSQFNINVRVSRTWGFGEKVSGSGNQRPRGGGGGFDNGGFRGGGGGGGFAGGGRGGGFFGGGDSSGQRYTITLGVVVRNLLNTTNPGLPESDLLSPRFGDSLSLAGTGGAVQSANRRMEVTLRFSF